MMKRKILLPLDGSQLAEQALPYAVKQAQLEEAELLLLRVIEPVSASVLGGSASVGVLVSAERQLREMAQDYMKELMQRLQGEGLRVSFELHVGNPEREILKTAESQAVSLIIMSTRGLTGFSRWLLGSVTDHVVRASTIPVLVIPVHENGY